MVVKIMKIAIGSDHGGYDLKEQLKYYLIKNGYEVNDVGTYSKDSCHYPEFAIKCAKQVSEGVCQFGVIVCTTGEGVTMAANKVKGVRAGLAYNVDVARLMREHNDANVMTLGAKFTTFKEASERLDAFLNAKFLEGRHAIRVQMINNLDK
jgi:ribose 5-phosphate isomerase B